MNLIGLCLFFSLFVYNVFCQSVQGQDVGSHNSQGRSDNSNSSTNPGLSEERKKQIRDQYYADKKYREELQKEQDAKTPMVSTVPAVVTPAVVPTVAVPTNQVPVTYQPQQQYTGYQQPQQYAQQPVAAVPVQTQQSISPTNLLTSGFLKAMLTPPSTVSDPSSAAEQLIPKLITPSLEQGMKAMPHQPQQDPRIAERQLLNNLLQNPYALQGLQGLGNGMYPQNTGLMQNPQFAGQMGSPMNSGLYGNTGYYPQQQTLG